MHLAVLLVFTINLFAVHSTNNFPGILVSGGNMVGANSNTKDLEYYCLACGASSSLNYKLKTGRTDSTSAPFKGDSKVIVMGGWGTSHGSPLATTEIVDLNTKKVTDGPNMTTARRGAASAVLNNEVWVCGGCDGKNILKSCEKLNKENKWIKAAEMKHARKDAVLAVLGDELFSIGGRNGSKYEDAVKATEVYNTKTGKWQDNKKASLRYSRIQSAAAVVDNTIYVCGGMHVDHNKICPVVHCAIVEKDSHKDSTERFKIPRGRIAVAAYEGKLYAFGGQIGAKGNNVTDTIEEYDTKAKNKEWKIVGNMTSAKADMSAVVVHHK